MNHPISVNVLGVIPARYGSQRFPGKPLALLAGKTLLQRTFENARDSGCFERIIIATDDQRIYDHVVEFGGEVFMTPESCLTGTERIAYLLTQTSQFDHYSVVVNIQGDEPCVSNEAFCAAIQALKNNPDAVMSTLITPIDDPEKAVSRSIVKCVVGKDGRALYFSRTLIPGGKKEALHTEHPYYRHIGIYVFRRDFVLKYIELENTPLQLAEDLEQLKILEHGYTIATACVEEEANGVDTPEDIHTIERLLCTVNTSLSLEASAHP